jgi:competence protein ComGC
MKHVKTTSLQDMLLVLIVAYLLMLFISEIFISYYCYRLIAVE